jgi:hypothetical protein
LNYLEQIWLLSEKGIFDINAKEIAHVPFQGKAVTAGAKQDSRTAVVVSGHEVWTLRQGKWMTLASSNIILNCLAWTREGKLLAGTEEARLGWVADGGIQYIDAFDAVPERGLWNTPWGGLPDTRSIAVSADGTIYANIHVGWIVRSKDGGKKWNCIQKGLEKDVHQVAVDPENPDVVFSATARGFHISKDHGEGFVQKPGNMPYLYQRACTCFPGSQIYLASTSRGPHGQADALLYRTIDEGDHWELAEGLPDRIRMNIDTYQIIILDESKSVVIIDNSLVYFSGDTGKSWKKLPGHFPKLYTAIV